MKLTVLGSGTSHGVPVLGCGCAVCRSPDPKDKRTRASLLVIGSQDETVIIDTGPEFRLQALRSGVCRLDAVLLTHGHADHLHGLDDVRSLSDEKSLPVYANSQTIEELRERFAYVFKTTQKGGGKPNIIPAAISTPISVGGLSFTPIPVKHGVLDIFAWRIDESAADGRRFAVYLTDTSAIPENSLPLIGSPQVLVIGALREQPHETHFNFEQALAFAVKIGAKQVFLTHLCHDFTHIQIEEYCQIYIEKQKIKGMTMAPAWDGLELKP